MGAYDTMDKAAGLLNGYNNHVASFNSGDSSDIAFGSPIMGYVGDSEKGYGYKEDVDKVAFDADFVTANAINGTVNGVAIAEVPFNTTHAQTMTDLIAAINALAGVKAVLDTGDVNGRTVLIQTKGTDCTSSFVVTGGASQAVATITNHSSQVFLGFAMKVHNQDGVYKQYDQISVCHDGEIWVIAGKALNANDAIYLYTTTGADVGKVWDSGLDINTISKTSAGAADAPMLVKVQAKAQQASAYAELFL